MRDTKELLKIWKANVKDEELSNELAALEKDEKKAFDAFYRDLEFGTGGLRGVLGVGTNRMNVYTVGKATQGLASYVLKHYPEGERSVAISYDSRIHSDLFAERAAEIFAANGIKVYIYKTLMPTPCLSFAVRRLDTSAGVMVTASHNPAKYNGYKVYGADGCQITEAAATEILAAIEATDVFADVKRMPFADGLKKGVIEYIADEVLTEFIDRVKEESVLCGEKLLFATKTAMVKVVPGEEFVTNNRMVAATKLADDDKLISVQPVAGMDEFVLQTKGGMFLRFALEEISEMKKASRGVRGMKLGKDDEVTGVWLLARDAERVITCREKEVHLNRLKLAKRDGKGTKVKL